MIYTMEAEYTPDDGNIKKAEDYSEQYAQDDVADDEKDSMSMELTGVNTGKNLQKHVIAVLVKNRFGVLSRVAGLFSRRCYNIDSLTVGTTSNNKISRMTIVVEADEYILEQITRQLMKLWDVISVKVLHYNKSVQRELVLIKVNAGDGQRSSIIELANIFRGKIIDISLDTVTIEITGENQKLSAFIEHMQNYGVLEIARTGITALERGQNTLK